MSLVAWWKLDETSGTIAHDNKGSNYNGNLVGNPTFVAGKVGNALNFDGAGDYVLLGNVADFKIKDKTISFWAKPSVSITAARPIFSSGTGNYYAGFRGIDGMMVSYVNNFGQKIINSANSVVPTNEWHFYTYSLEVIGETVNIKMYVDASLIHSISISEGISEVYGSNFVIGTFSISSLFFNGIIDDLRIYDYILIQEEIDWIYNNGDGQNRAFRSSNKVGRPEPHPISRIKKRVKLR